MKKFFSSEYCTAAILAIGAVLAAAILSASGCKTSPQSTVTVAYKSETAADAVVSAAMRAWGAYVATYHPPLGQEIRVRGAFNTYKSANLAAIDATEALANATGSNSLAAAANYTAASQQAADSLSKLVGLVTQFTTKTNQPPKSP